MSSSDLLASLGRLDNQGGLSLVAALPSVHGLSPRLCDWLASALTQPTDPDFPGWHDSEIAQGLSCALLLARTLPVMSTTAADVAVCLVEALGLQAVARLQVRSVRGSN